MFSSIISIENLLDAWSEFLEGKKKRDDVAYFSLFLIDNIYALHRDLKNKSYIHGSYKSFRISDPKPRDISKASVRDRLLHHAIYRILYPYFDRKFIEDSFSCRKGKGTHRALNRFRAIAYKASKNHTDTVWVLKCDIRKFFANIDHTVLKTVLKQNIQDQDTLWILHRIIDSFPRGLPLGNLTSQLLVNVYMHEFDKFVKHTLRTKYYIRYADDFLIVSTSKKELEYLLSKVRQFLETNLRLTLHPQKIFLKTFASGVDFLGWVHFPNHRVLRTATKRRMFRNIRKNPSNSTLQSYLGMLSHGNTKRTIRRISFTLDSF